jgi:TPR repeat protein
MKDYAKAAALHQQACDGDESIACLNLGRLYEQGLGVARDTARAALLYQKACDSSPEGCVGFTYVDGNGVTRDASKVAALFQTACHGGEMSGCYELGSLPERHWRPT